MVWQKYVQQREQLLAAESEPVKISGTAEVGLDWLVSGAPSDDLPGLLSHVRHSIVDLESYFSAPAPVDFSYEGKMLSFRSPLALGESQNDTVYARIFEGGFRDRAVLLLPYWNAPRATFATFGNLLARSGITCLQLSLPYHDERQTPRVGFAREMACENLSLTIRANRQAVLDARACLSWLDQQGYSRLGVVGTSIGSSIASIVAGLDDRIRAVVFLLMADDFADVVWTGSATQHVRQSLEKRFTLDDVKTAWAIVSPGTFAAHLAKRLRRVLILSGKLDLVFLPEMTRLYVDRLRNLDVETRWISYGCGHYTLGTMPYAAWALMQTLIHLRTNL